MTIIGKVFNQISNNLNMDKLNTGASNIWNIVKQKAAQLQTNIPRHNSTEAKKVLSDLAMKVRLYSQLLFDTYIHTYIHTYIYTYTYIHTYILNYNLT